MMRLVIGGKYFKLILKKSCTSGGGPDSCLAVTDDHITYILLDLVKTVTIVCLTNSFLYIDPFHRK